MEKEELLAFYLEKLHLLCTDKLKETDTTVLEALKVSMIYLEGEMSGY